MPIYEYRRPDGTTFDVQQSFHDEPFTTDPDTGVPVKRVLHAPAVHFKGKGFYNTDYGTRNRQRETAAENSSSEKGSEQKSDKSERSEKSEKSEKSESSASSDGKASKDQAKPKDAKPVPAT